MGAVFDQVRAAVEAERFLVGAHADERLRERGIAVWQVIAGVSDGKLLLELPRATPNPKVEVAQELADGAPIKAVWSWLARDGVAKLVTVHFFDD